jgi:hypothetical protein
MPKVKYKQRATCTPEFCTVFSEIYSAETGQVIGFILMIKLLLFSEKRKWKGVVLCWVKVNAIKLGRVLLEQTVGFACL